MLGLGQALIPQNLVFAQGAQKSLFVVLSLELLYGTTAPSHLYFRGLSVGRNVPLSSSDFMELLLPGNSVRRGDIAVFVVTGSLVLGALLLRFHASPSTCQPVNLAASAMAVITYFLWHSRKEIRNVPDLRKS